MARMENVYSSPVWAWPMRSWYDRPVQSWPSPWGSFATISSMACMASPELRPGAASPRKFSAGKPLYRSSRGES